MLFEYPIDTKILLRKKRKIRRDLLSGGQAFIEKKIAVLGGSTTNEVTEQLDLFLLHYGIHGEFYQSEYGKYREDALFGNPALEAFNPDIVYVHTNWRNIDQFPAANNTVMEINELLETEFKKFVGIWESIEKKYHCPVIQNNFDRPNYRLLGNRDISDIHGRTNFISRLNQRFYDYSREHRNLFINDLDYIAADFGLSAWSDAVCWHMYKYAMCLDAMPYVADSVAKIIKAVYGKNKKALVLDLDNTLWGGIIGDDGTEGISIGQEVPSGQVYFEFQQYCKSLKDIGVVLCVDSKNDEANALAGLNHPDGVLRPDDFVSIKANWRPKDINLIEIASELTLGTDSFVFIDDNPAEREIIRRQLPDVAVPEIGKAESFIQTLDHLGYFENVNLSVEDSRKTEMYHAKARALNEKAAFSDYGEYLGSLQMRAAIKPFEAIYIQRIAQLTNKSNQFNLTTLRCTEDDIRSMADSESYITLYGKLEDKFGDNGVVTVVAGEVAGRELHIRLWLMSCRVLKRGMEDAMMDELVKKSRKFGIDTIYGYFYPTPKNGMVRDFYVSMGFNKLGSAENEAKYALNVCDYVVRNKYIQVI